MRKTAEILSKPDYRHILVDARPNRPPVTGVVTPKQGNGQHWVAKAGPAEQMAVLSVAPAGSFSELKPVVRVDQQHLRIHVICLERPGHGHELERGGGAGGGLATAVTTLSGTTHQSTYLKVVPTIEGVQTVECTEREQLRSTCCIVRKRVIEMAADTAMADVQPADWTLQRHKGESVMEQFRLEDNASVLHVSLGSHKRGIEPR